jgi:hypothetical protein
MAKIFDTGEGGGVDRVLGQILRQAVWDRLDLLDELVRDADNRSLLSVARGELPRLTSGWRALLATHASDSRGSCPECSTRWLPRRAPCSVWRTADENLGSAETRAPSAACDGSLSVEAAVVG